VCDLKQRTALITGAASGIGAATAIEFARAGANIALGWFPGDDHDVNLVRAAVEATGRRVLVSEFDVRSTESVTSFVAEARQAFGRLDTLVASAGIARTVPAVKLTDAAWDEVIDLNLSGVWRCFRAVLPDMLAAGYGRLLATSSVAGTSQSWTEHVHYTTSKAGIVGPVMSLAIEVGIRGVTVNAVAPGVIKRPQSLDPINTLGAEGVAGAGRVNPVGRVGTPEDVAALFRFLASEDASFINGQLITGEGGRALMVN